MICRSELRLVSLLRDRNSQSLLLRDKMEQKGVQLDPQTFSCSICLDPLKDPVTLSCGHSYCMKCIKDHWDEEDRKRVYSCPQCRKTFTQRPVLEKSTVLTALVEELKKTGLGAAPDDHCYAGPEDVACDVCTGRKLKATKSCLVCRASYCEKHLQPHYDAATFKKHKLADPSKKLQENICSRHNEVMKIFCRTDRQIICSLCLMEEHKDHDTVSAAAERTEKQKELEGSRRNLQQRIKKQEKEELLLQQEVEDINASADEAVEHSEEIFTQMMRDVKQKVRSQQETQVSRVRELQEKLQQEVAELKRKDGELEKLSHTEDHEFLQSFSSLSALGESTHSSSSNTRPLTYFKEVTAAVSQTRDLLQDALRDGRTNISKTVSGVDVLLSGPEPKTRDLLQDALRDGRTNISETVSEVDVLLSGPEPKTRDLLQDALRDGRTNISETVSEVDVLLSGPEPKTRAEFLRYSREITLDPNTANRNLLLSEGNRKVTSVNQEQSYSDHPDRFTGYSVQVLSRESLTGRCYWEVERRGRGGGRGGAYVSVAYKNTSRTEWFGSDDKSWSLCCYPEGYIFYYNKVGTTISGPLSSRVGVYLDHPAGILSFYSISGTMTLLHRVQTSFTQTLHAGICLCGSASSAEFVKV
ncbi:tripartite motif-containing protein 16-like isoform X1 [Brachyistius frenatus]|uniref:tripartite motif-containing protein 16-like isoform X1 n=1 Tax=Brachyistius frenatus TaxID=100188 RepID=UPI0037E7ABB6